MKLVMHCIQRVREVSGLLFDAFSAPASSKLVNLCSSQGQSYARAAAVADIYVFGAILAFLAEKDTAIDADRQNLENYKQLSLEQRCHLIWLCTTAKLFDLTERKVGLVRGRLKTESGFELKLGKAPPGNQERKLSDYLDSIVRG